MKDIEPRPRPTSPAETALRPYEPPRVEEHGPLVRLTRQKAGGAADGFEGSGLPPA